MSKANEYWANAAECQRMADLALTEKDKAQWLKIAESWLRMAVGLRMVAGCGIWRPLLASIAPAVLPDHRNRLALVILNRRLNGRRHVAELIAGPFRNPLVL